MDLIDLGKKIVSMGLPVLGGIVAGPAGASAAKMIADQFGLTTADPTDIAQSLDMDPQSKFKLLELQENNRVELERLANADRASARDMLIKSQGNNDDEKGKGKRDTTPRNLAYLIVCGFLLATLALFIDNDMSTAIKEPLMLMLGFLGAKCSSIIDFYFGSSAMK